ncbi:MAG: hypothetical protein QOI38_2061 [Sphingomonadales bacterium]|jgi:hypothetical protein|nr:hypothetical protein [Sphingomonadales bacterium]
MNRDRRAVASGFLVTAVVLAALVASGMLVQLLPAWLLVSTATGCFAWWWDNGLAWDAPRLSPLDVILLALLWPATWTIWFLQQRRSGE